MRNTLGFTLNDGQAIAAMQIEESIKAKRHHLLSGDAGSGKTALMQAIAVAHHEKRKKFVCTAPTHQACTVLARKMKAAGINVPVVTTHALFGLRPRPKGDRLEFVRDDKSPPVEADIVGIDETSMIGEEMFEHINRWLHKRAVIFSGDPGQLFPVGEEESPTFATMHRSHLSEPVRQALGNPILEAAWAIRKSQSGEVDWSWCKPVHNAPFGVFVPRDPEAWMRKAFTSDEFNADSLRFRFICWTNKRVADVNAMIREWRYGPTDTPFVVGERALIRAPLVKARAIVLNTNEEVIVREIAASKNRGLSTWALTVETEDGMKVEAHMAQSQTEYQAKLGRLADDARTGDGTWKQFHAFKEALVTAQAPYALTTHNSQGLTLRNAMIDMPEFRRWVRANRGEGLRGLYVAATRPSHALICVGG